MKISHVKLVKIIREELLLLEQESVDADSDIDHDWEFDDPGSARAGMKLMSREIDSLLPDFLSFKLDGGPVDRFLTPPVLPRAGKSEPEFNIGYDSPTLEPEERGGMLRDDDPHTVSPDGKHTDKLFVVDPGERDVLSLTPRAAWQNDEPHRPLGQDIFGIVGTPVPAYIKGFVDFAGYSDTSGGIVVRIATAAPTKVDSKGNYIYPLDTEFIRLAHLDTADVETGDYVSAGEVVGTLGCTGNCGTKVTAPHIHLTVSGADSKGRYSYYKNQRNPYDLFDQSGWLKNFSDLHARDTDSIAHTKEDEIDLEYKPGTGEIEIVEPDYDHYHYDDEWNR